MTTVYISWAFEFIYLTLNLIILFVCWKLRTIKENAIVQIQHQMWTNLVVVPILTVSNIVMVSIFVASVLYFDQVARVPVHNSCVLSDYLINNMVMFYSIYGHKVNPWKDFASVFKRDPKKSEAQESYQRQPHHWIAFPGHGPLRAQRSIIAQNNLYRFIIPEHIACQQIEKYNHQGSVKAMLTCIHDVDSMVEMFGGDLDILESERNMSTGKRTPGNFRRSVAPEKLYHVSEESDDESLSHILSQPDRERPMGILFE